MKLLLVGGAGHVGRIIAPALSQISDCWIFDRAAPVEGTAQFIQGDVNDEAVVQNAVKGIETIVYLAMGSNPDAGRFNNTSAAFSVNVTGMYNMLRFGLKAGVQCVVVAGSLSVYHDLLATCPVDESLPTSAWDPYGMSKRMSEAVCEAGSQQFPAATIVTLRLMLPMTDAGRREHEKTPRAAQFPALGEIDTCALFAAAAQCRRPGHHIVQATGDVSGARYPNARVKELLGWTPMGAYRL